MIQTVQRFWVSCDTEGCEATVGKALPEFSRAAVELYASQNGWQVLKPARDGLPRRHFCPAHKRRLRDG